MAAQFLEAVKKGDRATVDRMLEADASLASAKDEQGTSAVLLAHYYGKSDVAAALLSRATALDVFEAATAGDARRVTVLVDADRSLADAVAHDGYSPLGLASFFKRRDVVKALLERGAKPNVPSRDQGFTPLHSAVATDAGASERDIVRLLLQAGADPNLKSTERIRTRPMRRALPRSTSPATCGTSRSRRSCTARSRRGSAPRGSFLRARSRRARRPAPRCDCSDRGWD